MYCLLHIRIRRQGAIAVQVVVKRFTPYPVHVKFKNPVSCTLVHVPCVALIRIEPAFEKAGNTILLVSFIKYKSKIRVELSGQLQSAGSRVIMACANKGRIQQHQDVQVNTELLLSGLDHPRLGIRLTIPVLRS